MKVKKKLQTDEGTFIVDCEFNEAEMDSIIEIGLNVLLAHGALPFQASEDEEVDDDTYIVVPPSQLEH